MSGYFWGEGRDGRFRRLTAGSARSDVRPEMPHSGPPSTAPRSIDLVERGPSSLLRLSLMTQSGALMFELRAADQAITPVQGAVVAYAPPFTRPAWPPHWSSGGWG